MREALVAQLEGLIDAYTRERALLDQVLRELTRLKDAVEEQAAAFEAAEAGEPSIAAQPPRPPGVELQVVDTERLLEFIEHLSDVPGVGRISVISPGPGRATLLVELLEGEPEFEEEPAPDPSPGGEGFTIACAGCGKVLSQGGPQVSHTFCDECVRRLLSD